MTLVQIGRPTSSKKFPPFNNHRDIPIETSPRHSQPRRMMGGGGMIEIAKHIVFIKLSQDERQVLV